MSTLPNKLPSTNNHVKVWWDVWDLIAGLDEPPEFKFFLTSILRHTNAKFGFAWASQKTIAWELRFADTTTVEKYFRRAKKFGIVESKTVKAGPKKQHNEYRLVFSRLEKLQRPKPSPNPELMTPPTSGVKNKVTPPAKPSMTPLATQFRPRWPAGEGLEVIHTEKNSYVPPSSRVPSATFALPSSIPLGAWNDYLDSRTKKPGLRSKQLLVEKLLRMKNEGEDIKAVLEDAAATGGHIRPQQRNRSRGETTEEHAERVRRSARIYGYDPIHAGEGPSDHQNLGGFKMAKCPHCDTPPMPTGRLKIHLEQEHGGQS